MVNIKLLIKELLKGCVYSCGATVVLDFRSVLQMCVVEDFLVPEMIDV